MPLNDPMVDHLAGTIFMFGSALAAPSQSLATSLIMIIESWIFVNFIYCLIYTAESQVWQLNDSPRLRGLRRKVQRLRCVLVWGVCGFNPARGRWVSATYIYIGCWLCTVLMNYWHLLWYLRLSDIWNKEKIYNNNFCFSIVY